MQLKESALWQDNRHTLLHHRRWAETVLLVVVRQAECQDHHPLPRVHTQLVSAALEPAAALAAAAVAAEEQEMPMGVLEEGRVAVEACL